MFQQIEKADREGYTTEVVNETFQSEERSQMADTKYIEAMMKQCTDFLFKCQTVCWTNSK